MRIEGILLFVFSNDRYRALKDLHTSAPIQNATLQNSVGLRIDHTQNIREIRFFAGEVSFDKDNYYYSNSVHSINAYRQVSLARRSLVTCVVVSSRAWNGPWEFFVWSIAVASFGI